MASLTAAVVVAGLAVPTLAAMAAGDDPAPAEELALVQSVSALQSTTTTTSTTLAQAEVAADWFDGLSAEEQAAFLFLTMDDEQRAAWEAFIEPPPAPEPEPEPEPAPAPPPPAPEPAPQPEPQPAPEPAPVAAVDHGSVWDQLAQCESGGNWHINTGNGFYGGLQFMHSTWLSMGGDRYAYYPHEATREQQIAIATELQAAAGWGQWPSCTRQMGLR